MGHEPGADGGRKRDDEVFQGGVHRRWVSGGAAHRSWDKHVAGDQINFTDRAICQADSAMTRQPTAIISTRAGMRFTAQPPSGAASNPPMISASSSRHGEAPSSTKNVVAAATVTKNSVVLTEPTAIRGACPEPT